MPQFVEGRAETAGAREKRPEARLWACGADGVRLRLGRRTLPCEERGEPGLTGRPRRPEIRRRTGWATCSIGGGPADLVRERSGPGDGGPGGLGGPFWAWACDGALIAELAAEQRGRPVAGLGGGARLG
ncbi:hypothetical protein NDU88_003819 [Pleurodeles waltl]|uniref:Uncharacterized protein n=1 Tax=Pleurodeles waltl TaxID=8319 RepID=A0AAV7MRT8_PLEWA|nr:hypothetical protein NDU88_003819 [Pleurodeles waltl]